jgi:hypothetical protein
LAEILMIASAQQRAPLRFRKSLDRTRPHRFRALHDLNRDAASVDAAGVVLIEVRSNRPH